MRSSSRAPRALVLIGSAAALLVACVESTNVSRRDDAALPDMSLPMPDAAPPPAPPIDAVPFDDAVVDAGPPVDATRPPDAVAAPPQVVSVDTRLGAASTVAGLANRVTCEARGLDDEIIAGVPTVFEVRPAEGFARDEMATDMVIGERAGNYQITCTVPTLGLRDATPSHWEVRPGEAAFVRATVEPPTIVAGETATVTCEAADALGNPVDPSAAQVLLSPESPGALVDDRVVEVTTAGRYRVSCALGAAVSEGEGRLDVLPGPPSALVAAVEPDLPVHPVGSVVTYAVRLTDAFGNVVDGAPVVWEAEPALPDFGAGRFFAAAEGRYRLSVFVDGPTLNDVPLADETEILIDAGGPAIGCLQPADGAMLGRDRPVTVQAQVTDVAGLAAVEFDGQPVELDAQGRFQVNVQPSWGLNVHELTARDAVGNENSVFCAFFAADTYLGENDALFDAIALHMTQAALDDGPPSNPITSLVDLLRRVLDSPALVATIDEALRAQNPIVPNDCRASLPIIGCVARLGAEYRGLRVGGPHALSANMVNGGLQFVARLNNLAVDFRTTGTISVSGTMNVDYVLVDLTFNVRLNNGRPEVTLRRTNRVEVGSLNLDLDGAIARLFDGAIDLIFGAFEGTVREQLVGALRGFLESELDALLSSVLDSLDLASLGLGFDVPTIDGSPPIGLALGVAFDQIDVTDQRMRIGISTRVNGDTRQPARSAGVPMVEPPARVALAPRGNVAGAISLGVINQVLHRLWRAGFFHFDDAGSLLGDLPEGTALGLRVIIPPAAEGIGGEHVRLHLGPAVGEVTYPGLFDEPLRLRLVATVTAGVQLVGDQLVFGQITIESLHFVVEDVAMTADGRATLERDLRRIVQALADQALNQLLPAVPIPDFALPDDLERYGVPRGTRLGLRNATLHGTHTHFILDGVFRQ